MFYYTLLTTISTEKVRYFEVLLSCRCKAESLSSEKFPLPLQNYAIRVIKLLSIIVISNVLVSSVLGFLLELSRILAKLRIPLKGLVRKLSLILN